jgi:hypothetical protein
MHRPCSSLHLRRCRCPAPSYHRASKVRASPSRSVSHLAQHLLLSSIADAVACTPHPPFSTSVVHGLGGWPRGARWQHHLLGSHLDIQGGRPPWQTAKGLYFSRVRQVVRGRSGPFLFSLDRAWYLCGHRSVWFSILYCFSFVRDILPLSRF